MKQAKSAAPRRSWSDLGRDEALEGKYRPPVGAGFLQARMAYQHAWEEAADDAAWAARVRDEE